jgi:hypothetical protein
MGSKVPSQIKNKIQSDFEHELGGMVGQDTPVGTTIITTDGYTFFYNETGGTAWSGFGVQISKPKMTEAYNTSENNRQYFDNFEEWVQEVRYAGGDIYKGRDNSHIRAMGHDGDIGEFDRSTGEGWMVDSFMESVGDTQQVRKGARVETPKGPGVVALIFPDLTAEVNLDSGRMVKFYIEDLTEYQAEGIGDTIRRGAKYVKRGMQGWGVGASPEMIAPGGVVKNVKKRNAGYNDDQIKGLAATSNKKAPKHSPQELQNRLVDREMKKRGLGEGPANDRLKAHAGALVQKLKDTGKKLVAPVKDPILDQMKAITDTANKRAHDAQNKKYAPKPKTNEADKHSFIGKIQRGNELKKKVDSTYKDIGAAQQKGDHPEASKAFRKHERYANLEHPGTWTKVKESYGVFSRVSEGAPIKTFALKEDAMAMAKRYNKLNRENGIGYVVRNVSEAMAPAVATAQTKMIAPTAAAKVPGVTPAPGAPKGPAGPAAAAPVDPAIAKAKQAAYQKNISKLAAPGVNPAQAGVSMQKQADDMQMTPTDNTNNAKIAGTLAGVLQDPAGVQQLKTLTDKYAKKPGQV